MRHGEEWSPWKCPGKPWKPSKRSLLHTTSPCTFAASDSIVSTVDTHSDLMHCRQPGYVKVSTMPQPWQGQQGQLNNRQAAAFGIA